MKADLFYAQDLAYVHHVGFGGHASKAGPQVLSLLARQGLRKGTLLDLGCGSGILAALALRAGHDVVGVDASVEMLKLARRHAPGARLVHASLMEIEFPPCSAITILGEGLNSAVGGRRPPWRTLFSRMARALCPGGMLIFDVVMNHGAAMNYQRFTTGKDWAVLVRVTEKPGSNRLTRHITVFRQVGALWRRSVETHHVRLLDRATVVTALREAGFRVRTSTRLGSVELGPRRLAFVATLPSRRT